ncbi:hypothetical protein QBC45DRAFT_98745 [Copromyces sp. CBS 386.78]|nr:hypothetical protein QBC45DRAFT_98745 [Copromyces sp. CBS 386.78]
MDGDFPFCGIQRQRVTGLELECALSSKPPPLFAHYRWHFSTKERGTLHCNWLHPFSSSFALSSSLLPSDLALVSGGHIRIWYMYLVECFGSHMLVDVFSMGQRVLSSDAQVTILDIIQDTLLVERSSKAGGWDSGLGLFFRVTFSVRQTVLLSPPPPFPPPSMFPQIPWSRLFSPPCPLPSHTPHAGCSPHPTIHAV